MRVQQIILAIAVGFVVGASAFAQNPAPQSGMVSIDRFVAALDANKDGSISKGEWKELGLMDLSFPLCDPNKDDTITKQEMAACAIPEEMDAKKEGILTVYAAGRFVIQSPGAPIPKPANAPPGITQATQFAADSPYVEGGPTGQDFIKLFDANGDGKVDHEEWEKVKNNTVFKPFRWPQYNKNRDQWITLDETPKAPSKI